MAKRTDNARMRRYRVRVDMLDASGHVLRSHHWGRFATEPEAEAYRVSLGESGVVRTSIELAELEEESA